MLITHFRGTREADTLWASGPGPGPTLVPGVLTTNIVCQHLKHLKPFNILLLSDFSLLVSLQLIKQDIYQE